MKNFAEAINELTQKRISLAKRYVDEVNGITLALNVLKELNETCLDCKGNKGSEYRTVAEAEVEWHDCSRCGGSGKEPKALREKKMSPLRAVPTHLNE